MGMYGRGPVLGEAGLYDIINPSSIFNRNVRAQVTNVDPESGVATVDYEGLPSGGKYVTTRPIWMSFPPNAGPSWGRFMPQPSDLVRLSFDFDNTPHVSGYDIVAPDPTVAQGLAGWPAIHAEYKKVVGKSDAPADRAKFATFVPLKPGEFDFMSSGGAYMMGSAAGKLYLAGGTVSMSFVKNDMRLSSRALLFSHTAQDCDFRIGQVRRVTTPSGTETAVGDGLSKEFSVTIRQSTAPGASLPVADISIGNVTDSIGIAKANSQTSNPTRFSYRSYTTAGVESLNMAIDAVGNMEIIAPTADSGMYLDFLASDFMGKFKSVTYDASVGFNVNSPSVNLGSNASHPLILSKIYKQAEITYATNLDATYGAVVTALGTVNTALSQIIAAFTAAGADPGLSVAPVAKGAFAAAATSLGVTSGTLAAQSALVTAQSNVAKTTFVAPYDTYLSVVSRTA